LEHIEMIRARGSSMGVPTGFAGFDEQVGGLFPGELIVIAARPGVGKTTLAVQIGENAATAREPRRVYFASLEMDRREIAMRMLCRRANVNLLTIRHGRISHDERDRITEVANELDPIHEHFIIHDKPRMTVGDIRRSAQRFSPQLIIVDYLQRIVPDDRKKQRYEQVADITKALKTMAREMGVAVLVLAQSSRDADNGGEPELRQLRESGDIEAESDVVTFLQTNVPWEKDGKPAPHRARWTVSKNRNGPTPRIRLTWDSAATAFRDPEDIQHHSRFTKPHDEFLAFAGEANPAGQPEERTK
jgi:replicative DNA helicase